VHGLSCAGCKTTRDLHDQAKPANVKLKTMVDSLGQRQNTRDGLGLTFYSTTQPQSHGRGTSNGSVCKWLQIMENCTTSLMLLLYSTVLQRKYVKCL